MRTGWEEVDRKACKLGLYAGPEQNQISFAPAGMWLAGEHGMT